MGIKNLNKLLYKYCPEAFTEKHISEFAFKTIAIDTSLYVCKFKSIHGDDWLQHIFYLVAKLRENDIHVVFIFDGKAPEDKNDEREDRIKKRKILEDKVMNLQMSINNYHETNEIDKNLNKFTHKNILNNKIMFNISDAEQYLSKVKKQIITKSPNDFKLIKELLDVLNVPWYMAPMEAECAATDLCKRGLVEAVLSEDTDCLTYGCPILITKFKSYTGIYTEVNYNTILEKLEITSEQFIDLCIMCGCDYNKNIPRVGVMKSFDLIKKYNDIDEISKNTKLDTSILKYKRCRELFTNYIKMDIKEVPYCGMPEKDIILDYLRNNNIKASESLIEKSFIHNVIVFE